MTATSPEAAPRAGKQGSRNVTHQDDGGGHRPQFAIAGLARLRQKFERPHSLTQYRVMTIPPALPIRAGALKGDLKVRRTLAGYERSTWTSAITSSWTSTRPSSSAILRGSLMAVGTRCG